MPVPFLGKALKGWTKNVLVDIIVQTTVNHKIIETPTNTDLNINKQPMPVAKVNRKPEEQRTWKWWSFIVMKGITLLKTDDIVIIDGQRFKIQSANNWTESGFQKYEAIEDYQ